MSHPHIDNAHKILISLGLPRAQQNERSALSLLALLDLRPDQKWAQAANPLMGITPIIDWIRKHYKKIYAPNTRESDFLAWGDFHRNEVLLPFVGVAIGKRLALYEVGWRA